MADVRNKIRELLDPEDVAGLASTCQAEAVEAASALKAAKERFPMPASGKLTREGHEPIPGRFWAIWWTMAHWEDETRATARVLTHLEAHRGDATWLAGIAALHRRLHLMELVAVRAPVDPAIVLKYAIDADFMEAFLLLLKSCVIQELDRALWIRRAEECGSAQILTYLRGE